MKNYEYVWTDHNSCTFHMKINKNEVDSHFIYNCITVVLKVCSKCVKTINKQCLPGYMIFVLK
jgi:hypothetical protein